MYMYIYIFNKKNKYICNIFRYNIAVSSSELRAITLRRREGRDKG